MSQPVTAAQIKELRERTGVGMGKCKEALEASNGDIELAIANLRKAGMASAAKKEGRTTNEGMISAGETDKHVAVVEVNAETDFVVKNDRFQSFIAAVADAAAKAGANSLDELMQVSALYDGHQQTIEQQRAALVQALGENIQIKRLKLLDKSGDKSIGVYSHLGGKIVTLVEISGSHDEEALAKDIAMHVAAAAPEFLAPEDVPADVIANERDIANSQMQGKPAAMIDKIVDGKLNAFYDANCLARQKFIKNDALSISDLVSQRAKSAGKSLKLTGFIRWSVGQS
jgi:elongation factor Ts